MLQVQWQIPIEEFNQEVKLHTGIRAMTETTWSPVSGKDAKEWKIETPIASTDIVLVKISFVVSRATFIKDRHRAAAAKEQFAATSVEDGPPSTLTKHC